MANGTEMNYTEIKIPVPWGHIAGKSWGNASSEKRVLLVHGIQHNCGAFNKLIPMLQNDCNMIAIDLPSHGRSSHFPPGLPIDFFNFVLSIKRVAEFLEWTTFSFIGHSFGSQVGTYFTAIFPHHIELLVVIDSMEPRPVLLGDTLKHIRLVANKFLEVENKLVEREPPVYSYEEIFAKTQKNNLWPLKRESAMDLMERSIKPFKNGFTFVNDQRLKCIVKPVLIFEQQKECMENICCPVLFLLAEENMARYDTYLKQMYEYNVTQKNRIIVKVKGDHAVHQNYPERISSYINEFLRTKSISNLNDTQSVQ